MTKRGLFITCEGGEGTGKTTLINRLEQELQKRGLNVLKTREPGGSVLGEEIRHWLLSKDSGIPISPVAELLLFLAARAQHISEKIKPALEAGQIVLCDRFNDSTVAYQGYARGLGVDFVQQLCDQVCGDINPDLTFFLDVDPKIGLERTKKLEKDSAAKGQTDRIESERLSFHRKVREGLQQLAQRYPERIYRIDAHQPLDTVFALAFQRLNEILLRKEIGALDG